MFNKLELTPEVISKQITQLNNNSTKVTEKLIIVNNLLSKAVTLNKIVPLNADAAKVQYQSICTILVTVLKSGRLCKSLHNTALTMLKDAACHNDMVDILAKTPGVCEALAHNLNNTSPIYTKLAYIALDRIIFKVGTPEVGTDLFEGLIKLLVSSNINQKLKKDVLTLISALIKIPQNAQTFVHMQKISSIFTDLYTNDTTSEDNKLIIFGFMVLLIQNKHVHDELNTSYKAIFADTLRQLKSVVNTKEQMIAPEKRKLDLVHYLDKLGTIFEQDNSLIIDKKAIKKFINEETEQDAELDTEIDTEQETIKEVDYDLQYNTDPDLEQDPTLSQEYKKLSMRLDHMVNNTVIYIWHFLASYPDKNVAVNAVGFLLAFISPLIKPAEISYEALEMRYPSLLTRWEERTFANQQAINYSERIFSGLGFTQGVHDSLMLMMKGILASPEKQRDVKLAAICSLEWLCRHNPSMPLITPSNAYEQRAKRARTGFFTTIPVFEDTENNQNSKKLSVRTPPTTIEKEALNKAQEDATVASDSTNLQQYDMDTTTSDTSQSDSDFEETFGDAFKSDAVGSLSAAPCLFHFKSTDSQLEPISTLELN